MRPSTIDETPQTLITPMSQKFHIRPEMELAWSAKQAYFARGRAVKRIGHGKEVERGPL
jgi:hypothetical protein